MKQSTKILAGIGAGAGILGAVGAYFYLNPPIQTEYPPEPLALSPDFTATSFWADKQGTISDNNYFPATQTEVPLPTRVELNGVNGEAGHNAAGLFQMVKYQNGYPNFPYNVCNIRCRLTTMNVLQDVPFIRVALATAWRRPDESKMYMEFDLYDSPLTWQNGNGSFVWNDPQGGTPCVEVKTYQMRVGQEIHFGIPLRKYFHKAYGGQQNAELDDIYFVIEKTDVNAQCMVRLDVTELSLKA